jgi:hypothetical protein
VHGAGIGSWYWRCGAEPTGTTNPNTGEKAWVNFWQRNAGETVRTVSGIQCDINEQYNPPPQGVLDMLMSDTFTTYAGKSITVEQWFKDVYNEYLEKKPTGVPAADLPPGTPPYSATAAQYAVNGDAYGYALSRKLDALTAAKPAPAPVALSDADLVKLAGLVATHLATLQFKVTP